MKKIIFLLFITVASYGQTLQNPTFGNVKIKQNVTDNIATKVNVQATDGTVNTIAKVDLQDAFYFASASAFPVTGITDKLYIARDNNILYRFNGTIYVPLSADVSGKEDIANKQNSLVADGTNLKYPTVTAVNAGIATADAGNVKTTGNQFGITGDKAVISSASFPSRFRAITSTDATISALTSTTSSSTIAGYVANSTANSTAIIITPTGGTNSTGLKIEPTQSAPTTGNMLVLSNKNATNGVVDISTPLVVLRNNITVSSISDLGTTTATSFVKSGATATNILLAGGTDIAQTGLPISTATQTALDGKVSGSGTTNFLPKFTGTGTVGNSIIQESGTMLLIPDSNSYSFGAGSVKIIGNSVANVLDIQTNNTSALFINALRQASFASTVTASNGTALNHLVTKAQTLYTNQSISANKTVTIAEFVNNNELVLRVDTTAGNITVTLPTFTALQGYKVTVRKIDSSANSVTITGVGAVNIDGASTLVVSGQYGKATVGADLVQYIIL